MPPDIKAGFSSFVDANANITVRVYPIIAPASATRPYAVYNRLDYMEHAHLTGQSGLYESQLQVDIWAASSLQAETAFRAIVGELDGYQGLWGATEIVDARISNVLDGYEEPSDGLEDGDYRTTITLDVWYR